MLLILTGPSCSGKSTIANELKAHYSYIELKSHTTRQRRSTVDEDYYFVSHEEFMSKDYVERVEYAGNSYGLSLEEMQKTIANPSQNYLVIVESKGAEQIWTKYWKSIDIIKVFIDCKDDALERRLTERGIDIEARRIQWPADRSRKNNAHFEIRNEDYDLAGAVDSVLAAVTFWFSPANSAIAACDGGCQLESGCWAYVLEDIVHGECMPGCTTNNIAEYTGLIALLANLATKPHFWRRDVTILMDSQLVVSQVLGKYKVKKDHLKPFHARVLELIAGLKFKVDLQWVPRENDWIKMVDKETKRLLS